MIARFKLSYASIASSDCVCAVAICASSLPASEVVGAGSEGVSVNLSGFAGLGARRRHASSRRRRLHAEVVRPPDRERLPSDRDTRRARVPR